MCNGGWKPLAIKRTADMTAAPSKLFRVALTADFYQADGSPRYRNLGLGVFDGAREISHGALAQPRPELVRS